MNARIGLVLALGLAWCPLGCGESPSSNGGYDLATGGDDAAAPVCGNGVIERGEDCDDGTRNGTSGDGCDARCHFVCVGDADCDDHDVCNGAESCVGHVCRHGLPPQAGSTCSDGKICRGGACVAPLCGDGLVTAPEECDDGNTVAGDGCEPDCRFTCVAAGDPARACPALADACAGANVCDPGRHVCVAATPLPDDTACAMGKWCLAGVCTAPMCGDGKVEHGEQCDDGARNGQSDDGCTAQCQYQCVNAPVDCGLPPLCRVFACNDKHLCAAEIDPTQAGHTCGDGRVCVNGDCVAPPGGRARRSLGR